MRVRQRDLYQMDERFAAEPIATFKVRLDGLKDTSVVRSSSLVYRTLLRYSDSEWSRARIRQLLAQVPFFAKL